MIPKEYAQVELKLKNRNISSNSGLAWIDKTLEFCGFWKDIKMLIKSKRSNNELSADKKIRSEILSRISGSTAIEDLEVLRKDKGLEKMTGKKHEVIEHSDNPAQFIKNALKPAKVEEVRITERMDGKTIAVISVNPKDKGVAIGKNGRNAERIRFLAKRYFQIQNVSIT